MPESSEKRLEGFDVENAQRLIEDLGQRLEIPHQEIKLIRPELLGGLPGLYIPRIAGINRRNIHDIHRTLIEDEKNPNITQCFGWIDVGEGGEEIISREEEEEFARQTQEIRAALERRTEADLRFLQELPWRVSPDRNKSQVFHYDQFTRRPKFSYFFYPHYASDPGGVGRNGVLGIGEEKQIENCHNWIRARFATNQMYAELRPLISNDDFNRMAILAQSMDPDSFMRYFVGDESNQRMLRGLYGMWERNKVCHLDPYRPGGVKILSNACGGVVHSGVAGSILEQPNGSPRYVLQSMSPD